MDAAAVGTEGEPQMSELKAYIAPTPDGTGLADYYLKDEVDKVIARHKYKRCLAMAM